MRRWCSWRSLHRQPVFAIHAKTEVCTVGLMVVAVEEARVLMVVVAEKASRKADGAMEEKANEAGAEAEQKLRTVGKLRR